MGKPYVTVTIKDVAKRAGVSIATVSHVLNKTRFVSDETAARVNEAVKELAYYPNLLVGSLRSKKTYSVGLVLPSISNETFGSFAETIQKMLFGLGYNLIICNTNYDLDIEQEAFNTLLMRKIDAVIAIPTDRTGEKLKEILGMGIPVVLVDRVIPGLEVDTIRVDNVKGTREAIEHLIKLGHRHIGYIDRKSDQSHSLEQKAGFRQALEEQGQPFEPGNVIRADGYDYASGASAAKALLRQSPQITALFAYYDITALGAVHGVFDMGLRVPEDVSVVGCDGMPVTQVFRPRLTTVSFPVKRIARTTCDMLMERLKKEGDKSEKTEDIVLLPRLLVRESTAPPRDSIAT